MPTTLEAWMCEQGRRRGFVLGRSGGVYMDFQSGPASRRWKPHWEPAKGPYRPQGRGRSQRAFRGKLRPSFFLM